jgi:hypothetical protein
MNLSSLTIRILLGAVMLSSSLTVEAQRARPNQAEPPPAKAPSYKVYNEASAPAGWKRYEFGPLPVISILLPNKPEEFLEQKKLGGTKLTTIRSYISATEQAVYLAYYAEDMPFKAESIPEDFKDSFYEGMLRGIIDGMKEGMSESGLLFEVKAGAKRPAKLEGLDGAEFDFTFGPMQGLARMAVAEQRAYMAMAMWTDDAPRSEREQFFGSFRILRR